jgi:hypothetical protein
MRSTKFELVINLKIAKALGLYRAPKPARPRQRGDREVSEFVNPIELCSWLIAFLFQGEK